MPHNFIRPLSRWVSAYALVAMAALSGGAPAADGSAQRVLRLGTIGVAPTFSGPPAGVIPALAKLGYVEGKNLTIEYRRTDDDPDHLGEAIADLVRSRVDIILAVANKQAFLAKRATTTIPIVVWGMHGALDTGLVSNLQRPGGNLTGTESLAPEIDAKRVELLRQLIPDVRHIAAVYDAGDQGSAVHLRFAQMAGQSLGIRVSPVEVRRKEDFASALLDARRNQLDGLLIFTSPLTVISWDEIRKFSVAHRIPTVCEWRLLTVNGCLVSYGPRIAEYSERNAAQIDKIFRGASAGDLPVEQMTKFELIINETAARTFGITLPRSVLMRADEVIP